MGSWTKQEKEILKEHWKILSKEELLIKFPTKTYASLQAMASRLGVVGYKHKWTHEEEQKLIEMWPLATGQELALEFSKIKHCSLQMKAWRLGVSRNKGFILRKGTVLPLLENTPLAFYWNGFLLADGHISIEGSVECNLCYLDTNHLEKLAELCMTDLREMPQTGSFSSNNNLIRFRIQDRVIGLELAKKFDIHHRKTYNPPSLEVLSKLVEGRPDLFLALFAGFVDGDGSIFIRKDKNTVILSIANHVSWRPFLLWLRDNLIELGFDTGHPNLIDSKIANTSSWRINKQQTLIQIKQELLKLNLPLMERKWDKIPVVTTTYKIET